MRSLPALALAAALALASAGTTQKYVGTWAVAAHLALLLVALPPLLPRALPALGRFVPRRAAPWLVAATVAALTVSVAVVYPRADSSAAGAGSDRDDAVEIAATRLLDGKYPYGPRTYLGNTISQMPGAIVLAAPFVAAGAIELQNVFWIAAYIAAVGALLGDARPALLAVWLALLASPALARELVTGGDLVTNTLSVLLGMLAVVRVHSPRLRVAACAFLGVALSSRANLVLVLPLVVGAVARVHGRRAAATTALATGAAFGAITLPFYLHDPDRFSPLDTSTKITVVGQLVAHGRVVFLAAAAVLALVLACVRHDPLGIRLLATAAALQALVIGAVVVADSIAAGRVDFFFLVSGYGLIVLFFALTAVWPALAAPEWTVDSCHGGARRR